MRLLYSPHLSFTLVKVVPRGTTVHILFQYNILGGISYSQRSAAQSTPD